MTQRHHDFMGLKGDECTLQRVTELVLSSNPLLETYKELTSVANGMVVKASSKRENTGVALAVTLLAKAGTFTC